MKRAMLMAVLVLLTSCSRCGRAPGSVDAGPAMEATEATADPTGDPDPIRLPKHDWNGLTVRMREAEARGALEAVGFRLVPSRLDSFPILDVDARTLTFVPIQGFTPPIVALETEKGESPLNSVYGLRLFFHSNRIYCFQPVYYADPVDLVEPGDEAVPPEVMSRRLHETFGEPAWTDAVTVSGPGPSHTSEERMTAWADPDLVVLYRAGDADGPPRYELLFFSPKGNRKVAEFVERLTKKKTD